MTPDSAHSRGLPADLASSIGAGERVLFAVRPGFLFIVASSWKSLVTFAVIVAVFFVVPGIHWRWGPMLSTLAGMGRLLWASAVWWNIRAVLTDRRVCVSAGVFRRVVSTLELGRIEHIALSKLVVERVFGLGTLWIASAGTGGSEVVWPMLNTPESVLAMLRESVHQQTGKRSAGAKP